MAGKVVTMVFENHEPAGRALRSLRRRSIRIAQVIVGGDDPTMFQGVVGDLEERVHDRFMVLYALRAGIAGALLGSAALVLIPEVGNSILGGFHTAIMWGGVIGATLGLLVGAFLHVDTVECETTLSARGLSPGSVLVAVRPPNARTRQFVEEVARHFGGRIVHGGANDEAIETQL